MNVYKWHIDFVGSNGLMIANSIEEVREKIYKEYSLNEFQLKNICISNFCSVSSINKLIKFNHVVFNDRQLNKNSNIQ